MIELSTDKAVGSGSVARPTTTLPSPDTVEILGIGSFGTAEGAPVGWVAVRSGSSVASVHLSSGGTSVDTMAPDAGIVVLAVPGNADLAGATAVGTDQGGWPSPRCRRTRCPDPTTDTCTSLPTGPSATTTTVPPTTTAVGPPATLPTPGNDPVTSQNSR